MQESAKPLAEYRTRPGAKLPPHILVLPLIVLIAIKLSRTSSAIIPLLLMGAMYLWWVWLLETLRVRIWSWGLEVRWAGWSLRGRTRKVRWDEIKSVRLETLVGLKPRDLLIHKVDGEKVTIPMRQMRLQEDNAVVKAIQEHTNLEVTVN